MSGVSIRTVEIGTAVVFAAMGAVAIWDSVRIGAGWSGDGPQSGYFPFWIGVLLVLASAGNLLGALRVPTRESFLSWAQARTILTVLVPLTLYVAVIPHTGIYVASALLVAWFMGRLGGFAWWKAALAGIAAALVTFVVFEIWFLLSLPKGPLEDFLGY